MRSAVAGPWSRLCALPALWTGIFYDSAALAAAWDLCKAWQVEDHERLRADVARLGLKAQVAGRTVQDVARDMVAIAREGLKRRGPLFGGLVAETHYPPGLEENADTGVTPAATPLGLSPAPRAGAARHGTGPAPGSGKRGPNR